MRTIWQADASRGLRKGQFRSNLMSMKKKAAKVKTNKTIDWEAVCDRARQRCSKHSPEERRRFRDEALRIIYGAHAEAATRSR
jgi:hypothetical protein